MISLQKLHQIFHDFPFVLIYNLLWHSPYTNFVIPNVLVDDGICISTVDVQLVGYISGSNPSVLLNR